MKAKELREMSVSQLQVRASELEREMVVVRDAVRAGKEKNVRKIRALKRELARVKGLQQRSKLGGAV